MERTSDERGGEIDCGAVQELERYRVYPDVSLSDGGCLKHILRPRLGLWW